MMCLVLRLMMLMLQLANLISVALGGAVLLGGLLFH